MLIITGAAGFIGSALLWKLNSVGLNDILAVDQNAEKTPKWNNLKKHSFKDYLDSGDFLETLESGKFGKSVQAIFHMGACSDTTETDKNFLNKNNLEYTQRIAKHCVKNNVYLSYASSAATYGGGESGFSDDDKLTPKLKPLNLYGQSKLDFDIWALQNKLEKIIVGFRFFNVYGPNEYHKDHMRSMVHKGFEQARNTGKIKLFKSYKKEYEDGGQKRDFVYVKDVVDVMLWFYDHRDKTGIFNLGQGRAESWNELAEAVFKACGKSANIEYVSMPENLKNQYQYFTEADMTKFKKTGCPVRFQTIFEGASDYIQNHLLKDDPYL